MKNIVYFIGDDQENMLLVKDSVNLLRHTQCNFQYFDVIKNHKEILSEVNAFTNDTAWIISPILSQNLAIGQSESEITLDVIFRVSKILYNKQVPFCYLFFDPQFEFIRLPNQNRPHLIYSRGTSNENFARAIQRNLDIYPDPIRTFIRYLFDLTLENCHIKERLSQSEQSAMEPLLYFTNMLNDSSGAGIFLQKYKLIKEQEVSSYNGSIFEESLKAFSVNNFSLFGVLVFVYAILLKYDKSTIYFDNVIESINDKFNTRHEQDELLDDFLRHKSILFRQNKLQFIESLSCFVDMFEDFISIDIVKFEVLTINSSRSLIRFFFTIESNIRFKDCNSINSLLSNLGLDKFYKSYLKFKDCLSASNISFDGDSFELGVSSAFFVKVTPVDGKYIFNFNFSHNG